jgi:uncharacterized membrane protein YsdA (DUF1294 family)
LILTFDCIQGNIFFEIIGVWLTLSGITGFFAMGIDKDRATHHEWRIPEKTLFAIALIGGSFGIAFGSSVFHHKTSKLSFILVAYLIVGAWLLLLQELGFTNCLFQFCG